MERRKILLGSGATLATILAGCSSSETGDDDPEEDDEESFGDEDDDYDDNDHDDEDDHDDDDDEDEYDDVPGFDNDNLAVEGDKLEIMDIRRDGDKIDVVAETETTDRDELYKEFEKFGDDIGHAVADPSAFAAEIETIEWVIEHDGSRVIAVYVDVQWILDYLDDELTEEELGNKVLETKH